MRNALGEVFRRVPVYLLARHIIVQLCHLAVQLSRFYVSAVCLFNILCHFIRSVRVNPLALAVQKLHMRVFKVLSKLLVFLFQPFVCLLRLRRKHRKIYFARLFICPLVPHIGVFLVKRSYVVCCRLCLRRLKHGINRLSAACTAFKYYPVIPLCTCLFYYRLFIFGVCKPCLFKHRGVRLFHIKIHFHYIASAALLCHSLRIIIRFGKPIRTVIAFKQCKIAVYPVIYRLRRSVIVYNFARPLGVFAPITKPSKKLLRFSYIFKFCIDICAAFAYIMYIAVVAKQDTGQLEPGLLE